MNTKVALLVIYNHRYDKNIPVIDKLYENRFSYVFHIVPFYDGSAENVIPVYENSYYFQGYIAQAFHHLNNKNFTHYFIVADDMFLRPSVNENNIWSELGLGLDECYLSRVTIFQERRKYWFHTPEALTYRVSQPGVEIENILPTREEATMRFKSHGFPTSSIPIKRFFVRDWNLFRKRVLPYIGYSRKLDYPLVGGYSDILLVPNSVMPKFCLYCGAFAATKLFVEIAIPTAIALTADAIKTDKDLNIKRGDWPISKINTLLRDYKYSLKDLYDRFPEDYLYLHPIKLSKWK